MKLHLDELYNHLVYVLSDNGDWEYTREGVGKYNNRVFVVNLDDTGEDERELLFVSANLTVADVMKHGLAAGSYTYDNNEYWCNWDAEPEQHHVFREAIGLEQV